MKEKVAEVAEMKDIFFEKADKLDQILKQVAKLLAVNTNYATMISSPKYKRNKLKFIQLSRVEADQLLVVIMLEGNLIKNRLIQVDEPVSEEEVAKLNLLMNTYLQGLSLQEINMEMIQRMKVQADGYGKIISNVIDAIAIAIQEEDDFEIYTSGTTNLLKYPELGDPGKRPVSFWVLWKKNRR